MSELETIVLILFGVLGWVHYFRENRRRRDYATDLMQVIHDYPESTDSLRRSLKWDEIKERVEE